MARDPGQHARPDLILIVKNKHEVWPAPAFQRPMRTGFPLDPPAYSNQGREHPAFVAGQWLTQPGT
jgi:hypothetical protein